MRPAITFGLFLLASCGGNAANDPPSHSEGGATGAAGGVSHDGGGSASAQSGGNGGSGSRLPECESPSLSDSAVDAAARELAGVGDEWTKVAWANLLEETGYNLTIEGASSLAGMQCLRPAGSLVLQGGNVTDFSPLAGWEVGHQLTLEADFELSPSALASLAGSGFPQRLELHDLGATEFPQVAALSRLTHIEATGTAFESLEGLVDSTIVHLVIQGASLSSTNELSSLKALQHLDLSASHLGGPLDLSTLTAVDAIIVDDTDLSALPTLGAPAHGCNRISGLRLAIPQDELESQAEVLCSAGWVVTVSSGAAGPLYECGTPMCRI